MWPKSRQRWFGYLSVWFTQNPVRCVCVCGLYVMYECMICVTAGTCHHVHVEGREHLLPCWSQGLPCFCLGLRSAALSFCAGQFPCLSLPSCRRSTGTADAHMHTPTSDFWACALWSELRLPGIHDKHLYPLSHFPRPIFTLSFMRYCSSETRFTEKQ